jgi:hypothetical protein
MTAAAETIGTSWMTSPEQAVGKSATDSRNITYVNSRRETRNSKDARNSRD